MNTQCRTALNYSWIDNSLCLLPQFQALLHKARYTFTRNATKLTGISRRWGKDLLVIICIPVEPRSCGGRLGTLRAVACTERAGTSSSPMSLQSNRTSVPEAERQPKEQEGNTAVVSAAATNFINSVAKQDLKRGWQGGEWHIPWEGPSRCVGLSQHSCTPNWKRRHCPGSMREGKMGTWRDRRGF